MKDVPNFSSEHVKLRVATWNVERPNGQKIGNEEVRIRSLQSDIKSKNADIWILTETSSVVSPGEEFCPLPSDFIDTKKTNGEPAYAKGESRTTIWSKYPIKERFKTHDSETAVSAMILTPAGELIVYGTVLPYHAAGSPWPYRNMGQQIDAQKAWQLHYKSIGEHCEEIASLRKRYRQSSFCFGGDLNQSRDGHKWFDGREWYGTKTGRDQLTELLKRNELICVTEEDFVESGELTSQSLIDHLCFDVELEKRVVDVVPWEPSEYKPRKNNSDHSGVYVDLVIPV